MALEVKLEELAPNLEGGTVVDVKVAVGDVVEEGQTLLKLEADKGTISAPAPASGRVTEVFVKKDDEIKVGQTLCFIEQAEVEKNGKPPQPSTAQALSEPRPGISREDTTAQRQPMAPSSRAPAGDGAADREPAKSPAPSPLEAPGQAATLPVGPSARMADGKLVPAGPATRLLAREWGIDLRQVPGSGRGGRITREDVKQFVRSLAAGQSLAGAGVAPPPLPDFSKYGPIERQGFSGVRKTIARQMSLAWNLVPHVTQHDQADVTELDAFRRQHEKQGAKLTLTAFAIKAVAIALKRFPHFNSSLDLGAGQLVLKRYYHIGVAVDTDQGLLVPVLRDADRKSVQDLAEELAALAEKARRREIEPEEMRGSTFTITNLGGLGGLAFTPIVNYPEVAILGLSRAHLQPTVKDGAIVPRLVLPLSLSYDHRVIDGADAARFTRRLAEMLEKPMLMLLDA
jgi:pyruvate dehydrogenase E2 component (dihydrolipoamide acetyltransferase)